MEARKNFEATKHMGIYTAVLNRYFKTKNPENEYTDRYDFLSASFGDRQGVAAYQIIRKRKFIWDKIVASVSHGGPLGKTSIRANMPQEALDDLIEYVETNY